jgi:diguanylate cyclase (GGDEF)-like protein
MVIVYKGKTLYMEVNTQQLNTAVWIYDLDNGRVIWANNSGLALWNSESLAELSSRDFKAELSDAIKEMLLQYIPVFQRGETLQEHWKFTPKGIEVDAFCQFSGIKLEDGRLAMLVEATCSDLLQPDKQFSSTVLVSNYHLVDGHLISGNLAFTKHFSHTITHLHTLFSDQHTLSQLKTKVSINNSIEMDALLNTLNGQRWFHITAKLINNDKKGEVLLLHMYDMHERKMTEQNLRQQAWADPLTNLLNRRGLAHKLDDNLTQNHPFTLLYIDLDGFKMVNDSLGHSHGDTILLDVSKRLKKLSNHNEFICRFGGDEFLFVNKNKMSPCDLALKCNEIINALSAAYINSHGIDLALSASIGVAYYPDDAQDFEHVIALADAAMYQAKRNGKQCWVQYQIGMEHTLKRISLVSQKLSFAIENNELSLHYQPINDLNTGEIISFEALLRWHNQELGHVSADETIRVAEETGLIFKIEEWVISQAIKDLVLLKQIIHDRVTMAVNISGLHIASDALVDNILTCLEQHNLTPQDFNIELTESVLLSDSSNQENPINTLINNGINLNIDDFGTGYSSLAYLHKIPASTVKVDKAFLEGVEHNTITLECIQRLVTALKMKCLIEGIETPEQSTMLHNLGFHIQQGYFHGRPQPIEHYLKQLASGLHN